MSTRPSGGFIAPFSSRELDWDFRLPRVKSINASGHKFGLAPLGFGWIIWREAADLPEDLIFRRQLSGGPHAHVRAEFFAPGRAGACQYYNFLRLGHEGYRKIQQACSDTAFQFADELGKLGSFEVIYDGRGGIPGVCWKLKEQRLAVVHTLRSGRSATLPGLASAGLYVAGQLPADSRAAHLGPARNSAGTWPCRSLTTSSRLSITFGSILSRRR